jgi:hypothetical protein
MFTETLEDIHQQTLLKSERKMTGNIKNTGRGDVGARINKNTSIFNSSDSQLWLKTEEEFLYRTSNSTAEAPNAETVYLCKLKKIASEYFVYLFEYFTTVNQSLVLCSVQSDVIS